MLTPKGCFMDAPPEGGACKRLDGIAGAGTMALSPDGASLYLASSASSTLVSFKRDVESGALTPTGCQVNTAPEGADSVYQPEEDVDEEEDEDFDDEEDSDAEDEDYDRRDASTCTAGTGPGLRLRGHRRAGRAQRARRRAAGR